MVVLTWRFFVATAAVLAVTLAVTDEEINNIKKEMDKCREEFHVSLEDTIAAHKTGDISKFDPCYLACKFKKMGTINEDGVYDTDAVRRNVKNVVKQDSERIEQIINICSIVNEKEVSDGNKGCERAKLLFACLIKEEAVFAAI